MKNTQALFLSLLFLFVLSCDREESLLITETEDPRQVVIIEEEDPPVFLRSVVDSFEYVDTIGMAIDMGNNWFYLANVVVDDYECSSTTSGYSYNALGSEILGGNPYGFTFSIFINMDPSWPLPPKGDFGIPNGNGTNDLYANFCDGPPPGTLELDITYMDEARVAGTYSATVVRVFNPDTGMIECGTPEEVIKTVSGSFDLPLSYCD